MKLLEPVAAVPKFFGRDALCTSTVTVYGAIDSPPSPSPTPGIDSYPLGVSPGSGPVTVTVVDTTTVTSTIYGGPQIVTVMVTSVSTSVETRTVVQTQTITQNRTIVQTQTITPTLAPQTVLFGGSYGDQDRDSITYTTVTSTITTTNTISISSRAGVPPQPSSRPYYSNVTTIGTYSNNSTNYSLAKQPLSSTTFPSLLDAPPASTVAPLASYSPVPPPSSYSNVSSSNYENGLYFVNWSVTWFSIHVCVKS